MNFNLNDYEPVSVRLSRFLKDVTDQNKTPIVETEMIHYNEQRVVFRARIGWELENGARIWVATGFEEETRGEGHVNKTSHLANCETSAIGRALANWGYAGSDPTKRPSREEMAKVARATDNQPGTQPADLASPAQLGKIRATVKDKGRTLTYVLNMASTMFNQPFEKIEQLNKRQASAIIERLLTEPEDKEPPF